MGQTALCSMITSLMFIVVLPMTEAAVTITIARNQRPLKNRLSISEAYPAAAWHTGCWQIAQGVLKSVRQSLQI